MDNIDYNVDLRDVERRRRDKNYRTLEEAFADLMGDRELIGGSWHMEFHLRCLLDADL